MAAAARAAGVAIVTGDTKVVERGKGDGVFINTTGIGVVPPGVSPSGDRARPGDAILVSGTIGDHGVAIMSTRESLSFDTEHPVRQRGAARSRGRHGRGGARHPRHARSDPRRAGDHAERDRAPVRRRHDPASEAAIPVREEVAAACELLGLDPLYVANEGKLVAICAPEDAETLLNVMRKHPLGADAAIIGTVREDDHRFVQLETTFGGKRIVDWLAGEQLPRIC